MLGWLGAMLGSKKAMEAGAESIKTVVTGAVDGIDALVYTSEEKVSDIIGMVKSLQDQFTPRAVTRRILAVIVYANFYLHVNVYLGLLIFSLDKAAGKMVSVLGMEFKLALAVTVFYFGYYGFMTAKKSFGKK